MSLVSLGASLISSACLQSERLGNGAKKNINVLRPVRDSPETFSGFSSRPTSSLGPRPGEAPALHPAPCPISGTRNTAQYPKETCCLLVKDGYGKMPKSLTKLGVLGIVLDPEISERIPYRHL